MIIKRDVEGFFAELYHPKTQAEISNIFLSAPGYKPGMTISDYREAAKEMVDKGDHHAALKMYIWYHHHCLEIAPSQYGVRLSFVLHEWKKLGEFFPFALRTLFGIRKEKTSLLLKGKGNKFLFHDVFAINRTFEKHRLSIVLYKNLEKINPDLANTCWWIIEETFFHAGDLDTIKIHSPELLSNPEMVFNTFATRLNECRRVFGIQNKEIDLDERRKEILEISNDAILSLETESFVKDVTSLINLIKKTGNMEKAKLFMEKGLILVDSKIIKETFPIS